MLLLVVNKDAGQSVKEVTEDVLYKSARPFYESWFSRLWSRIRSYNESRLLERLMPLLKLGKHILVAILLFISFVGYSSEMKDADVAEIDIKDKVFKAFDYLTVRPSRSLEILATVEHRLEAQSVNVQIKAYVTGMWAGHYLSSTEIAEQYSQRLTSLTNSETVEKNAYQILSVLSSQLWRLGDNASAKLFSLCATRYADSVPRLLSNILSLGAIFRRDKQHQLAQQVFDFGLKLAIEKDEKRFTAGLYNNSSVLALDMEEFEKAAVGFEKALNIRYEISHLSGQVTAGTNLMLVWLFLEEWEKFERLAFRIERLQNLQNSPTYVAYFNWLKTAYSIRRQAKSSDQEID